jgi:hypothetical protein
MKSLKDDTLACLSCLKGLNIHDLEEFEEDKVIDHFKNLLIDI